MGKIYTIVLNSVQGIAQPYTDGANTTTTDIRSIGYFYDWSLLPNKKYKLNFNFSTTGHTSTLANTINLYSDFAQLNTRFATSPVGAITNTRLNYSFLGMAKLTIIGANSYLYADENLNGTIYLDNRPSNNNFSLYILNSDINKSAYSSTTLFGNYTLTLSFEELE